jgi:hypothetical protein
MVVAQLRGVEFREWQGQWSPWDGGLDRAGVAIDDIAQALGLFNEERTRYLKAMGRERKRFRARFVTLLAKRTKKTTKRLT